MGAVVDELTPREREVMELAALGLHTDAIAARMTPAVAPRTVAKHLERIYEKFGVEGRSGAVALWVRSQPATDASAWTPTKASAPGSRRPFAMIATWAVALAVLAPVTLASVNGRPPTSAPTAHQPRVGSAVDAIIAAREFASTRGWSYVEGDPYMAGSDGFVPNGIAHFQQLREVEAYELPELGVRTTLDASLASGWVVVLVATAEEQLRSGAGYFYVLLKDSGEVLQAWPVAPRTDGPAVHGPLAPDRVPGADTLVSLR